MPHVPTRTIAASLPPGPGDRVVLVVAHPDDETIGAGALLGRVSDMLVVHVTDGAPRSGPDAGDAGCASWRYYAALRRRELEAATGLAGLPADHLVGLGHADQGASLDMAGIARRIAGLIADHRPGLVLTHPYEGGHPDHDAVSFAVHAACALLRRERGACPPVAEMAFYHDGDTDGVASFQDFLPMPDVPVMTLRLESGERECKRRMLDAHRSQAGKLVPFRDDVERYRPAPAYDFARPPHAGRLNYERFDWGMTGRRWRALAAEASAALGLGGMPWA